MNINRLLSRRDKDGSPHRRQKSRDKSSDRKTRPLSTDGLGALFKNDPQKKLDREQSSKIHMIKQRLLGRGFTGIEDEQINYALLSKHAGGNMDKAFELVVLFQESVEGVIKSYNPAVHMRGAENREGVTCYLDALLFAMFARLGSFEPILYTIFDDEPRRRLSTLIRLWVNMLRTGKLIQTDITSYLQEALAACGWEDAAQLKQQDTSEAFSFITEKLQLPLLTLKMDIFHTGTEDATDDHKLIHERLLEVAVPEDPGNGRPIQLEDCLESYFNNRVEVVRRLERSNTLSSIRSGQSSSNEKGGAQHVEIAELAWSSVDTPTSIYSPGSPSTPTSGRNRATSFIRHRVIQEDEKGETSLDSDVGNPRNSVRKGSIRKEVLMPAWQFFNLIRPSPIYLHMKPFLACSPIDAPVLIGHTAWYTKNSLTNDAEVAAHFAQTRPVLGICLKRYAMTADGRATRQNTFIDIPLDIRLPHFIQDDVIEEEGPLVGNFKLSLQSVICHRGKSVHSGHYISIIRGTTEAADGDFNSARKLSNSSQPPHYPVDRWIKFDDLAEQERVTYIDIEQALKDEMPYLLFYQVQPIYDVSPPSDLEPLPPSYTDSDVAMNISQPNPQVADRSWYSQQPGYFEISKEEVTPAVRFSTEIERPKQGSNLPDGPSEERRGSLAFTDPSIGSAASSILVTEIMSAPATPTEETTAQRMSRAASRFTKSGSRSRPASASGENRLSATFSRMASMMSKEQLNKVDHSTDASSTNHEASGSRDSVTTDDNMPKSGGSAVRSQGKKRDKSKGPVEKSENDHHHHHQHHHLHKGKGREKHKEKDVPDRECTVM